MEAKFKCEVLVTALVILHLSLKSCTLHLSLPCFVLEKVAPPRTASLGLPYQWASGEFGQQEVWQETGGREEEKLEYLSLLPYLVLHGHSYVPHPLLNTASSRFILSGLWEHKTVQGP